MEPQLEQSLRSFQEKEKELQAVLLQRQQLELQLKEIEMALDELKKASGEVYKSVGGLFLKTTKEEAERELLERKDLFEVRLKSLRAQEESLKNQLLRMQRRLEEDLTRYQGS